MESRASGTGVMRPWPCLLCTLIKGFTPCAFHPICVTLNMYFTLHVPHLICTSSHAPCVLHPTCTSPHVYVMKFSCNSLRTHIMCYTPYVIHPVRITPYVIHPICNSPHMTFASRVFIPPPLLCTSRMLHTMYFAPPCYVL